MNSLKRSNKIPGNEEIVAHQGAVKSLLLLEGPLDKALKIVL
jgi:hypothetical protein